MRSASVDFPWSIWAIMQKLRMFRCFDRASVMQFLQQEHECRSISYYISSGSPAQCAMSAASFRDGLEQRHDQADSASPRIAAGRPCRRQACSRSAALRGALVRISVAVMVFRQRVVTAFSDRFPSPIRLGRPRAYGSGCCARRAAFPARYGSPYHGRCRFPFRFAVRGLLFKRTVHTSPCR